MTWDADIANADEQEHLVEFVDEIIDVLHAMGMINGECNVDEFIFPPEEDQVSAIMTLHCVTNAKATLTLRLHVGRRKK